jgi:hypothetical protein
MSEVIHVRFALFEFEFRRWSFYLRIGKRELFVCRGFSCFADWA